MALLPTPSTGRLLRWKSDGTLENVTITDLLDSIASPTQPAPGTQKYWIDTSLVTGVGAAVAGVSMQVTAGTPSIVVGVSVSISQVGASMVAVGGTPTVAVTSVSSVSVVPAGVSMAATAGTAAVGTTVSLTLAGASMAATGYAPSVSTITSREVTPSGVSMAVAAGTPTWAGGSSAVAVSDNFDRSNGGLGASWTTITSLTNPAISSNKVAGHTSRVGARWSADSFASDQYAEAAISEVSGSTEGAGPAVRIASDANTYYWAWRNWGDDGEGSWDELRLYKCVGGTPTQLGSTVSLNVFAAIVVKIVASGSTITVSTAASHGGTYTQRIQVTSETSIASGSAGFAADPNIAVDSWYGGDA